MLTTLLLAALLQNPAAAEDPANVLVSFKAPADWELTADPASPQWTGIAPVRASRDFFGEPSPLPPTEIRSRWTSKNLYLLFVCPYKTLHLKPEPVTTEETDKLWNWDVAEAFIGSDYLKTSRYKEFQVSPQGEFVDLDIDQDNPKPPSEALEWQSGFTVKARKDTQKNIWYAEMSIPFSSLDIKSPRPGRELRIGLFRIEGEEPNQVYVTWRPTGARTFHVPSAFGSLVLR